MDYGAGAPMNASSRYAYTASSDFVDLSRARDNVKYRGEEFLKAKARRDRNDPTNTYALSDYKRALNDYVTALSSLVSESKDSIYVKPEEYKKTLGLYEEYKAYQDRLGMKMASNASAYANDPYKFVYPNAANASVKGGRRSRKTRRVRRKNRKSRRV